MKRFSPQDEVNIERLYVKELLSSSKIGKIYSCRYDTIIRLLRKRNVSIRKPGFIYKKGN